MKREAKCVLMISGLVISNLISGCGSPLLKLPSDELRSYSTEDLILAGRGFLNPWAFDPEIDRELIRRQQEDMKWLIENASNLEDFDSIPFTSIGERATKASQIRHKYEGIPAGVYVGSKFTLVSAKWIDAEKFANARRQWYIKEHPELSNAIQESVSTSKSFVHHRLIRGMTSEQVRAAIGDPHDIKRSTGSWGVHEQWIYGTFVRARYFYFENGILDSWQD